MAQVNRKWLSDAMIVGRDLLVDKDSDLVVKGCLNHENDSLDKHVESTSSPQGDGRSTRPRSTSNCHRILFIWWQLTFFNIQKLHWLFFLYTFATER